MIVVGLVALVGVSAVTMRTVTAQAEGCGRTGAIALRVAATPDIAPAVQDVATAWGRTEPKVNGRCIRVEVTAAGPAEVAEALAAHSGGTIDTASRATPSPQAGGLPSVWIPDSSSWLDRISVVDQNLFEPDTPVIAASPVVAAMPDATARALGVADGGKLPLSALGAALTAGLTGTGKGLRLAVTEPRRDAAGLAGAMVLRNIVVSKPEDLPKLVAVDRAVGAARAPDTPALVKAFGAADPISAMTMSEQQVLAYDKNDGKPTLQAVPFDPGAPSLDYPYATLSGQPRAITQAAGKFRNTLRSPEYREVLARYGFRSADGSAATGFPAGHGVTADRVPVAPISDMGEVNRVIGVWAGAITPSRLLALADITASMAQPLDPRGGPSRIDVLRQAAIEGLRLFSDDSQVGLWGYAANLGGRDFIPRVGVAPLAPAQRAELQQELAQVHPVATNESGLYESVLAAYKVMRDGYVPGMSNTVVVFTDGQSNKRGGMDIDQALQRLQELVDTTRPVRIVVLGIGPAANVDDVGQLSQATGGGKPYTVDRADKIREIFLQALLKIDWNA